MNFTNDLPEHRAHARRDAGRASRTPQPSAFATELKSTRRSLYRKKTTASNAKQRHLADLVFAKERNELRTVVSAWTNWIVDRMSADTTGRYLPFVLQNIRDERTVDVIAARRKTMSRVCDVTTLALNPTSSRSHPARRDATLSVGVIALPATTINGTHIHGFLRVPVAHRCAIDIFAAILRLSFRTNNLWISRNTELDQIASKQEGSLPYLASDWKKEVRHWEELDYIPAGLFARLDRRQIDNQ